MLGAKSRGLLNSPTRVPLISGSNDPRHVVAVSAARDHLVVLTTDGELYSCGSGAAGKLGHGDVQDRAQLKRVLPPGQSLSNEHTVQFKWVSTGQQHTLAVTVDGQLMVCGCTTFGELGLPDEHREVINACYHPYFYRAQTASSQIEASSSTRMAEESVL